MQNNIDQINELLMDIDFLIDKDDLKDISMYVSDESDVDFPIVGAGDPTAFKLKVKDKNNDAYDKDKYKYYSNDGVAKINNRWCKNCCIFLALTKIFKYCDYDHFKKLRKNAKTDVETVYNLLKNRVPHLLEEDDDEQSDILIEEFVKLTKIKIRVVYMIENESLSNWDLFDGNEDPDALIFQYPNHFECAISKKFIR
jgi:hypothetical protein